MVKFISDMNGQMAIIKGWEKKPLKMIASSFFFASETSNVLIGPKKKRCCYAVLRAVIARPAALPSPCTDSVCSLENCQKAPKSIGNVRRRNEAKKYKIISRPPSRKRVFSFIQSQALLSAPNLVAVTWWNSISFSTEKNYIQCFNTERVDFRRLLTYFVPICIRA